MAETDIEKGSPEWWLQRLGDALTRRQALITELDDYYEGKHPVPEHVRTIKLETEYRVLMSQAVSNWPELIVDAVDERLEVLGFTLGNKELEAKAWDIWQRNGLDSDSGLVHQSALTTGRAFEIVWADSEGRAEIVPEHASTTIVAYREGSRRERAAALRRWVGDDGNHYATVYLPDGLYKFQAGEQLPTSADGWKPREVDGEEWPLPNPLKKVPVVEFAVNRDLRPAPFGSGHGEFERVRPIINRINTTVFAGLMAQAYASFPIRALIGDKIKYDAEGDPIAPFKAAVDRLIQIENPEGKLMQLAESDLSNYIKFAESHIKHLAAITKTPSNYLLGDLVNLSADAIRAAEAGLVSKVTRHTRSLDESHEEVMRLSFAVEGIKDPITAAAIKWKNPATRSDAQLADAAAKLETLLPWQMVLEYLGYTPQDIIRAEKLKANTPFEAIIAAERRETASV